MKACPLMKIILAGSTTFIVGPHRFAADQTHLSEYIAFLKGGKANAVFVEHIHCTCQNDVKVLGRVPFFQDDLPFRENLLSFSKATMSRRFW